MIISWCLLKITVLGVLRSCELISCFLSLHYFWVKIYICYIPFSVSFYLDNFMETCILYVSFYHILVVLLADLKGVYFTMLWCYCFFFFLFSFVSYLHFSSRICLAIKCSSQNLVLWCNFVFLPFEKKCCPGCKFVLSH